MDGSRIIVLFEWVERLANRSTHWPVGRPIHQAPSVGQEPRPVGQHLIIGGWAITAPPVESAEMGSQSKRQKEREVRVTGLASHQ